MLDIHAPNNTQEDRFFLFQCQLSIIQETVNLQSFLCLQSMKDSERNNFFQSLAELQEVYLERMQSQLKDLMQESLANSASANQQGGEQ